MNKAPDAPERWIPAHQGPHAAGPPQHVPPGAPSSGGPPRRHELLSSFFDMDEIPPGAQVVVRPSLRAALDVPFKVILVLLFLFLPFGTTGVIVRGPEALLPFAPLAFLLQFAPALIFAFAPAIRLVYTRYVIDEDGIRVRSQVLSATESRVPWEKVTAIEHRRTFFDRVLGIERLNVVAYGVRGTTLRLVGLRNAKHLRDLTSRKMREHATAHTIFSND